MSVRTMARVWEHSQHAGSELLMLLAIADFADDDGRAYPSVDKLAFKCRMSSRNVNHLLATLRGSGELEVRQNEGPRGTNRYRVVTGVNATSPMKPLSPLKVASSLKPASPTPEAGFPESLKPASDEPSLNHQEPPIAHARKSAASHAGKAQEQIDALFVQFWAAYPRKTGKPDAVKAFLALKVTPQLLTLILAGLAKWKAHPRWIKDGGQYIKTPGPWLRGRLWEDEEVCGLASGGAGSGWWVAAGFDNPHEAKNAGCFEHTAHLYREGKRLEVA